jgi:hypothetical protein
MRPPASLLWLGLMAALTVVPGAAAQIMGSPAEGEKPVEEPVDDPYEGRFVYLRSGDPIALQASPFFAAALVPDTTENKGPFTPPDGLELDPRGNRPDLIERGVTLFRVPGSVAPRGLDGAPLPDAWKATLRSDLPSQPVFEHGAALRIPSDEVIVAFDPSTTLKHAKRLLSGPWDDLDARQLREFRPGIFICVLRNASAGRAFEASRMLTQVEGVLWAEPSFINVYLETPGGPPVGRALPSLPSSLTHQQTLESKFMGRVVSTVARDPEGFVWSAAIDGHFENEIDRWIVARDEGSNRILPIVVRERTHDGSRSVYMSGKGLAGNAPLDSYHEGASSYLISPVFDMAAYREVFVELWFWARFEDPVDQPRRVHDLGRVLLYDVTSKEYVYEYPIAPVGSTGDLTRGPGTDRGWRKLMFRVPIEKLATPLQVLVHFYSDGLGEAEGLYVDDIRVLYSTGDGGDPTSRDPTAHHQYAIMPRGQIAGWPARSDPAPHAVAAWSAGIPKKKEVIVALLDDGVTGQPGRPTRHRLRRRARRYRQQRDRHCRRGARGAPVAAAPRGRRPLDRAGHRRRRRARRGRPGRPLGLDRRGAGGDHARDHRRDRLRPDRRGRGRRRGAPPLQRCRRLSLLAERVDAPDLRRCVEHRGRAQGAGQRGRALLVEIGREQGGARSPRAGNLAARH